MRPIDRVLERLEGVKTHNGYFMALCPAHDDSDPSLSIKEGDDGRVLIKCHAGCTVEDFVAAIDLEMKDLFWEEGGGGGVIPSRTTAPLHHPQENPHNKAEKGDAESDAEGDAPDAPLHHPAEAPDDVGTPGLRLVKGGRADAEDVTLEAYAEYVGLPVDFLKTLGLREIHYIDQKAVKIPYLDQKAEEVCVRFRVSLTGTPKIKTRKNDKHRLYGLQSIEEMKKQTPSYAILVEGESDAHVGWYRNQPVIGVPGATGFQSEWVEELEGFEKIYGIVEPDEAGEKFWERLAVEGSLQERLYRVELDGAKDLRELHLKDLEFRAQHPDQPDQFFMVIQEALDRATHWMDIAESEALERTRQAWEKCAALAQEENILAKFYETLENSGVAGEENTVKILYLALTSRRFERPVSVVVKGPSSGGKSFLVEKVSEYFPKSAVYGLTAMSEKTLAYSEEPIKHRFLILYEASGMNSDFQTYLIRSLLSEGRLRYETLEKTNEGIKPKLIEREGPTGLIVTTTLARLHAENETRMLSLTVTDTQEQTGQILETLADEDLQVPDPEEWIALQEWIEGANQQTTIPFARELARLMPPVAVRLRRDFKAILTLIRAHALLHQTSREVDEQGRIVATVSGDYAAVRELVADLVAEGVDASVSETIKETVAAVEVLTSGAAAEADDSSARDEDEPLTVSARKVAEELKLDKSAATRRLYEAVSKGYLKNLESRRGKPGRYMLGDPLPADVVILPTVEELAWCTTDATDAVVQCSAEGTTPLPPRRLTVKEVLEVRTRIQQGMSKNFALKSILAKPGEASDDGVDF